MRQSQLQQKIIFMSPTLGVWGGGGHIVFSVDPLGVGISFCVGVAFCLHYLLNEWMDFGQTYTNLSLGEEKCWLDFDDLDPIFKVTQGLKIVGKGWIIACLHLISWRNQWILTIPAHLDCWDMLKNWLDFGDDPIFKVTRWLRWLENGLSAPSLLNEWMDFYQTCTSILLRHGKELIRFWWPSPFFQGYRRAQIFGKWLVCTLPPEWMGGFWLNLYIYIVVTWKRTD